MFQLGSSASDRVLVAVLGRPDARDDWLECRVDVSAGAFSASYVATFSTQDFPQFRRELEQLYQSLDGRARFDTHERQLQVACSGNGRGGILVEGVAQDSYDNVLRFRFETDQTFLPALIAQLREIEHEYPDVGHRRSR